MEGFSGVWALKNKCPFFSKRRALVRSSTGTNPTEDSSWCFVDQSCMQVRYPPIICFCDSRKNFGAISIELWGKLAIANCGGLFFNNR